jgi:hypothetical protein
VAAPSSGEAFAVLAQIYRDRAVETGERLVIQGIVEVVCIYRSDIYRK